MLKSLLGIFTNASAFLQSGVVPPEADKNDKQLAETNHFASKKFFAAFSGFFILGIFYVLNISLLFIIADKPALIGVYPTLFSKTIEVFAAIMAVYLGGQAVVDLKYNSSSNASAEGKIEISETTERKITNEKEGDYVLEVEDEIK